MSARDDLLREMTHQHLYMTDDRANKLIDAYAHELLDAATRDVDSLEERMGGHLWAGDVRDLLNARDPHAGASPVRPDEEPTP